MARTTFEEAKLCPKCGIPGQEVSSIPAPAGTTRPGTKIHVLICKNETCNLAEQSWLVQVNPDGSVPPAGRREEKQFPALNISTDEKTVVDRIQAEYNQSVQPEGAELYRRR